MSDVSGSGNTAVRLRGISKHYRLYKQPVYRFLDLFGLCPSDPRYYTTHQSLEAVNADIARGEKVAIIGRNGAGKSTLLKIIARLVQPTAGSVDVNGRISNLLQIGTGFHPDFTGRQNVFASLAHQGIIGDKASRLFDEIVAFADIEEYIDQPMKTYSTGMCSRLMFSSSIVMTPDILIVDEILGVGDAYFSHKSFNRMRDLCANDGTTLLLVTHDLYSALNLCDRFIWIDRGRVRFDGDGKSAIALYEASVKEQEEQRLRLKSIAESKNLVSADGAKARSGVETRTLQVLVRSRTGFALPSPLALERIELAFDDGSRSVLPVGTGASEWSLLGESSLGPAEVVDGRPSRTLRRTGSIYHKAEWTVTVPADIELRAAKVTWHYTGAEAAEFRVFTSNRKLLIAGDLDNGSSWQDSLFARALSTGDELDPQKQIDYGTGFVRIRAVEFLDLAGHSIQHVKHGDVLNVRIRVAITKELIDRAVTFVLVFWRQGSSCLAVTHRSALCLPNSDEAVIDVTLDPLRLGSGLWYVNVGVGECGIYERPTIDYFAVDPAWHHLLTGRFELRVDSVSHVDSIHFVVHSAKIECRPAGDPPLEARPIASNLE